MRYLNFYLNPKWFYTSEQYEDGLEIIANLSDLAPLMDDPSWTQFCSRTWKNWTQEAWFGMGEE